MGAFAAQAEAKPVKILADTIFLQSQGIKPLYTKDDLQLSVAEVSEYQANTLSHSAHKFGKCGGFERISDTTGPLMESLNAMQAQRFQALAFEYIGNPTVSLEKNLQIEKAVDQASENNIQDTVSWLSKFPTRFHKSKTNNLHVEELAKKIESLLSGINYPYLIEMIQHQQTPQKTLHVRLTGKDRPNEVVVLGGHLDSITSWGMGTAPGADDNASGSASILEALRLMTIQDQPQRSIDFFWYAGEEAGLLGSSEIASAYKQKSVDVIGVMQLDMTLFPGEGELVFGDISDFTHPWLRTYMKGLSDLYVHAKWKEDQCGYGCSDHASWHRQGYAAVMPFESSMDTMNKKLHTRDDVISPALSFKHAAGLSKLALAFILDLANSELRPTF